MKRVSKSSVNTSYKPQCENKSCQFRNLEDKQLIKGITIYQLPGQNRRSERSFYIFVRDLVEFGLPWPLLLNRYLY